MAKEFNVGEVVMVDSYPRYAGRVEGIAQKVERFACKDETMLYYLIKKNWRKSEWVRQTEVAEILA